MSTKKNGATNKGYLINQKTKDKMSFQYNPTNLDYEKDVNYSSISSPGTNYPLFQYISGNALTFSIELFMYCKGYKTNTINKAIKFIKGLVPKDTNSKKFEKPPEVIVCYGKFIRRCVITKYHVHIEESDTEGNPVIANVTLDFTQVGVK